MCGGLTCSRQNYINHRHIDHLGAHIDIHRDDVMRKYHPNIAHSDVIRGVCSGLTSPSHPVSSKIRTMVSLVLHRQNCLNHGCTDT